MKRENDKIKREKIKKKCFGKKERMRRGKKNKKLKGERKKFI